MTSKGQITIPLAIRRKLELRRGTVLEFGERADHLKATKCADVARMRSVIGIAKDELAGKTHDRVYFGATVTVVDESGGERTVSIVGVDELDPGRGRVSWISPIATALLKASVGDVVTMLTPRGREELEIIAIRYDELP